MEQPGWGSGQFNFNLAGEPGRTVAVEGSTNLVNWAPIATSTLGSAPLPFTDPQSAQFPRWPSWRSFSSMSRATAAPCIT